MSNLALTAGLALCYIEVVLGFDNSYTYCMLILSLHHMLYLHAVNL
jgi:hypothetical protein